MNQETIKNTPVFTQPGCVKVIQGSILAPHNAGLRFVLNINNMLGKTRGPWYDIFDKKWKKVKEEAKGWYANKTGAYKCGAIQSTCVQSDVWVIHMLCQNEKGETNSVGLAECLKKTCALAKYEHATVHVSALITKAIPEFSDALTEHLVKNGVSVFYYEGD